MLGKLLKYDFKANMLYLLTGYGVYMAATVLFALMLRMLMGEEMGYQYVFAGDEMGIFMTIGFVTTVLLWFASVVGLMILLYVLVIRRFYTNLISDQGYLTLTLPVSAKKHMLSKLISGWCLQLLTVFVLAIGVFLLIYGMAGKVFLRDFWYVAQQIWKNFFTEFGLFSALNTVLGTICELLMIYFAICVGQLCQKHKVWGAIGTYLGLMFVEYIVNVVTALILILGDGYTIDRLFAYLGNEWTQIGALAWTVVQILVYFFLGSWLLEKRANLS